MISRGFCCRGTVDQLRHPTLHPTEEDRGDHQLRVRVVCFTISILTATNLTFNREEIGRLVDT